MSFKSPAAAKQANTQGTGRSKNQENVHMQPTEEKTLLRNNNNSNNPKSLDHRTAQATAPSGVAQRQQQQQQHSSASIENNQADLHKVISNLEEQNRKQVNANEQIYRRLLAAEAELQQRQQPSSLGTPLSTSSSGARSNHVQTNDLNNRYHELAHGHNTFLDNVRSHSFTIQQQLDSKDAEIARLRALLDARTGKLNVASITQERNFDRCIDQDREIIELQQDNARLKAQLDQAQYDLDVSNLTHKAEGTLFVEVEHLRADVQRLLQMLKNTQEYKDFADYSDDSSQSIRFLKDIRARTYVDNKCHESCKLIRPCMCIATDEKHWVEDEKLLWVPEEAFKFAHAFKLKYRGELTDTLIENLLFELNKIWSKREQRLLARVKGNSTAEVAALRRQLASNPTYDEHQAKITIARLQNSLKQAHKENREAFGQRERRNAPGSHYVKEAMKETHAKQRSERRQTEKLTTLKNKVTSIELNKYQDQAEKAIFMEGAQWVTARILSEFNHLQVGINTQVRLFQNQQAEQSNPYDNASNNNADYASTGHAFNNNTFSNHANPFLSKQSTGTAGAASYDASYLARKTDGFLESINNELFGFQNRVKQLNRNSERDMIEAAVAMKASLRPQSAILSSF